MASCDLFQMKEWSDASGQVWLLEQMENRHRRNVLAWLRRRSEQLALQFALDELASPFSPDPDSMASDDFEDYLHWLCDHHEQWLEQTPLVQRLLQLSPDPSPIYAAQR